MPEVRTRPERLHTAMPLACVGGFLDAYTFVGYNGVFANTQTGNVVLLGVSAQAGHWRDALLHIPPIVAFMLAVALAQMLAQPGAMTTANLRNLITKIFEWRAGHELTSRHQAALLAWIIVAFAVGAGVGGLCTRLIHHQAAWIAAAGLIIVLVVVVVQTRRIEQHEGPSPTPSKPQNHGA